MTAVKIRCTKALMSVICILHAYSITYFLNTLLGYTVWDSHFANCDTQGVICLLTCTANKLYTGKTFKMLKDRGV